MRHGRKRQLHKINMAVINLIEVLSLVMKGICESHCEKFVPKLLDVMSSLPASRHYILGGPLHMPAALDTIDNVPLRKCTQAIWVFLAACQGVNGK